MLSANAAATLRLLSNDRVQIQTSDLSIAQRAAVDISTDLISWRQFANTELAAGVVLFSDPAVKTDEVRFYRLADADQMLNVSGYIDGGPGFGPVGGAQITVKSTSSTISATADGNGFFQLNQRIPRADFPLVITAAATGFLQASRTNFLSDAGAFMALTLPHAGAPSLPALTTGLMLKDNKFHFEVTSGPRAGDRYTLTIPYGYFFYFEGDVRGSGLYFFPNNSRPTFQLLFVGDQGVQLAYHDLQLWLTSPTNGTFAGIPSTNGTLSGNGRFTFEPGIALYAPANTLAGHSYTFLTDSAVGFAGAYDYFLTTPALSAGSYSGARTNNTWFIRFLDSFNNVTGTLTLEFTARQSGTATLIQPMGSPPRSGPFISAPPPADHPAPANLTSLHVTGQDDVGSRFSYTINLSGGSSGTFTLVNGGFGRGTYSYTRSETTARLVLNYTDEYAGDIDDYTLEFKAPPGSATQSNFAGTQKIQSQTSAVNGIFIYQAANP